MNKLEQDHILAIAASSKLVNDAKYYAIKVHNATNHKYDGKPYETHLQLVFDYACKFSYLLPSEDAVKLALASAWTHDTIEDCRQTYNDVKEVLGIDVADITYALTNEKGKNRKERANDKYYAGIRSNFIATFVKICDRMANVAYSKSNGSKMIEAYRKEQQVFAGQLWSLSTMDMFDELQRLIS